MIHFFGNTKSLVYAVQATQSLNQEDISKLEWLFGNQPHLDVQAIQQTFLGTRPGMVTPWSTNAVEITQNMGIQGIERIEMMIQGDKNSPEYDPMFLVVYPELHQDIFKVDISRKPVKQIDDIATYNIEEGLAMNEEEVKYLEDLSKALGRPLTDSEVFGFSQVNSEHCRHKIFNGIFEIDGEEMPFSLFQLIRHTTNTNPNTVVSAYKDNVSFIEGPVVEQFAPTSCSEPSTYETSEFESVLSLKAETHNFPTTVEPYNGAGTGSGGEVRDRLAGGRGSLPLAGSAVYMTAYSRLKDANHPWEKGMDERAWLYQTPLNILLRASDGAADFGNKFGQPVISGSVLTFEHQEDGRYLGYDKVIMMAGGIGFGKASQALKDTPKKGDQIVVMGGDNYRIGMGGAAVSSADTGAFDEEIELNAVQRSNPEMQKRVANAIRAMVEREDNPIVSIHDHGAGGHLNCLSELVEETGGHIDLDKLPVGDKSLSAKELIGNESQERMGLVISKENLPILEKAAKREQAPMYVVGEVSDDMRFSFESKTTGEKPVDFALVELFGSAPVTVMADKTITHTYKDPVYETDKVKEYFDALLRLEAVGSKDWIVNKADSSVSGKVAKQQTTGPLQLPLNNLGAMALDYNGKHGVTTTTGHAPISALIDPEAGSRNAITEAITNMVWAPLEHGMKGIALSANWMWACRTPGEDARLYKAVKAVSDYAVALGVNIPTGKDSLSMTQKYDDKEVIAPGTVIITASAHTNNIRKIVEPTLKKSGESIYYINFSQDSFKLGGSSFAQTRNAIGSETPDVKDSEFVLKAFAAIQKAINADMVSAGHDIGSGGMITSLLEMCIANPEIGAAFDLNAFDESDIVKILFSENTAVLIQAQNDAAFEKLMKEENVEFFKIGSLAEANHLEITHANNKLDWKVSDLRKTWMHTSFLLDSEQTGAEFASLRFKNFDQQPHAPIFPANFTGQLPQIGERKLKAAIIREKGSNSEREMANALYQAGFDVKDVHMTDLMEGRETLEDVQFLAAVGGFSNSDVLGSAKGWAGTFKFNEKANKALQDFFKREDTLSLGICNGSQLFLELGLLHPEDEQKPQMLKNDSGRFESQFVSVDIPENNSVMLHSLAGSRLSVWIAHGEGKYVFPEKDESKYNVVGKYTYKEYPANPNGSDFDTAMLADKTGRHLAMMPHIERSIYPWNWGYYPEDRKEDTVSPWLEAFVNARKWLEEKN